MHRQGRPSLSCWGSMNLNKSEAVTKLFIVTPTLARFLVQFIKGRRASSSKRCSYQGFIGSLTEYVKKHEWIHCKNEIRCKRVGDAASDVVCERIFERLQACKPFFGFTGR